jgi:hypothetical protein
LFGRETCFVSSGLIEAFLVQLFTQEAFGPNLEHLTTARCFRENVERRIPGIVFAIEFTRTVKGLSERMETITITEEEKCTDQDAFYTERLINIFLKSGPDTEAILTSSLNAMTATVRSLSKLKNNENANDEMPLQYYKVIHGLHCYECSKSGYDGFFNNHYGGNGSTSIVCNGKHGHRLNNYSSACNDEFSDDHRLVVKRIAYSVSNKLS